MAEQKQDRQWQRFAGETASAVRDRLRRLSSLSEEERERLSRRLQEAIAASLEVTADLKPRIEEQAARLIARSDTVDPVAIAWARTRERARRTAAIGAVTTVPALVPGVGTALAALGLVADWRYVAEQQRDLVLEIAAIFGQWPDDPTGEARNLFLGATATAFAAPTTGKFVTEVLARQIARRGVSRLLPGAGAAVAGALNYIATIALGRAAIEHFGEPAGFEVHGLIPTHTHPAMPWLRNAVVGAVESGQPGDLFSEEARKAITKLSPHEREELLDLAAALTLARDRDPVTDPLLSELGSVLGFATTEVQKAVADAIRSTTPLRDRLGAAIRQVASRGGDAIERAWRRAAQIARPKRPRRKPTDQPKVKKTRKSPAKRASTAKTRRSPRKKA
jgi:uncharacterized protein (DUF697 family)